MEYDKLKVTIVLECDEALRQIEALRWKVAMLDVASAVPIEWEA